MEKRLEELTKLRSFIENVDAELTMITQHLQWDRNNLLEGKPMVSCKHDENHRVPNSSIEVHEQQCLLTKHGYSKDDILLPDPPDTTASTLIKLNKLDIEQIIKRAAAADPSFKRVSAECEPLSLGRLQAAYSPDERRAIHDAVVAAAPSCHDLSDLVLPNENGEAATGSGPKSRAEILAELRDMKRRRTKYRVAAKTRNYSDLLRDVIKTQMEVYTGVKTDVTHSKQEPSTKSEDKYSSKYVRNSSHRTESRHEDNAIIYSHSKSSIPGDTSNDTNSLNKRTQNHNLVQYPDPRERKHKRDSYYLGNHDDRHSSSRKSYARDYEHNSDTGRRYYDERSYKKERRSRDKSVAKRSLDAESSDDYYKKKKIKEEKNYADFAQYSERKCKEGKDEERRHRNKHDERRYDIDRKREKTRDHKSHKTRDYDATDGKKYERSGRDK